MVKGADGQQYGPIDAATMQAWVMQGRIGQRTEITDLQTGLILAAGNMPAVKDLFRAGNAYPSLGQQPGMQNIGPYSQGIGQFPQNSSAPFGHDPYAAAFPPCKKVVAIILGILFGSLGFHRFYTRHYGIGAVQLMITLISCGLLTFVTVIWSLIECVLIFTGSYKDAYGRDLI